jgi:hypothetical protein
MPIRETGFFLSLPYTYLHEPTEALNINRESPFPRSVSLG